MLQRFLDTHPESDKIPHGLTLEGKIVWFCEPRDVGADQNIDPLPARAFQN